MKITIKGEEFEVRDRTLCVHIREPYYTAGKKFGFTGVGVSLSKDVLDYASKHGLTRILMTVGKYTKMWEIPLEDWIRHSYLMIVKGTMLRTIEWSNKYFNVHQNKNEKYYEVVTA